MSDRKFLTLIIIASIIVSTLIAFIMGWFIAPCTFGREKTPQCIEVVKENIYSNKKEIKFLQNKVEKLEKILENNEGL